MAAAREFGIPPKIEFVGAPALLVKRVPAKVGVCELVGFPMVIPDPPEGKGPKSDEVFPYVEGCPNFQSVV